MPKAIAPTTREETALLMGLAGPEVHRTRPMSANHAIPRSIPKNGHRGMTVSSALRTFLLAHWTNAILLVFASTI